MFLSRKTRTGGKKQWEDAGNVCPYVCRLRFPIPKISGGQVKGATGLGEQLFLFSNKSNIGFPDSSIIKHPLRSGRFEYNKIFYTYRTEKQTL